MKEPSRKALPTGKANASTDLQTESLLVDGVKDSRLQGRCITTKASSCNKVTADGASSFPLTKTKSLLFIDPVNELVYV